MFPFGRGPERPPYIPPESPIADEPTRVWTPESVELEVDVIPLPDDSFEELPEHDTEALQELPRSELAFDIVLPPNIGEGRFLPEEAIVYKKDGEGRPVLEDGRPVIESITYLHPNLDFSKPPTREFFASLREISPFHVRSLLSEVHYPTGDAPVVGEAFVPRQLRLHGRLFSFERHLGGGGMGDAVLYRDEQERPIVMKLLSRHGASASATIRSLEEATVHSLIHPVALEGERPSMLSQAMRMSDTTRLSQIARELIPIEVWDTMSEQERERAGEELRDLCVGFVDAATLVPDGNQSRSVIATFLPFEEQGDLLASMRQRRRELSQKDVDPEQMQEREQRILQERIDDAIRMAESLFLVHKLGITHRDVKPANFFRGTDGALRLADFGMAKKETVRALRGLERTLKLEHEQLVNDAQGLYHLAARAQESGTELSDAQSIEVWNWLRDFVAYQTEPELSAHERLTLMKGLIERAAFGERALLSRHRESLAKADSSWAPSDWQARHLERIEEFVQPDASSSEDLDEPSVTSDTFTDELLADEAAPTLRGTVVGSPRYMAPEAARGEEGKMKRGPKEDTFAFGVVIHDMFSMGGISGNNDAREIIRERALADDAGIEYDEDLLSEQERAVVSESIAQQKAALQERMNMEGAVGILAMREREKEMEIKALLEMPGLARIVGLSKWCTRRRPQDRPTDVEVIKILTLAKAEVKAKARAAA